MGRVSLDYGSQLFASLWDDVPSQAGRASMWAEYVSPLAALAKQLYRANEVGTDVTACRRIAHFPWLSCIFSFNKDGLSQTDTVPAACVQEQKTLMPSMQTQTDHGSHTQPTVVASMKRQEETNTIGDHGDLGTICFHTKPDSYVFFPDVGSIKIISLKIIV